MTFLENRQVELFSCEFEEQQHDPFNKGLQTCPIEVSFLNPHTHKPWVDPTHVGRCGLQKLVADSCG